MKTKLLNIVVVGFLFWMAACSGSSSSSGGNPSLPLAPLTDYAEALEAASYSATANYEGLDHSADSEDQDSAEALGFHVYFGKTEDEYVSNDVSLLAIDIDDTSYMAVDFTTAAWDDAFVEETGEVSWITQYSCFVNKTDGTSPYFAPIENTSYTLRHCDAQINISRLEKFDPETSESELLAKMTGNVSVVLYDENDVEMGTASYSFTDFPIRIWWEEEDDECCCE